MKSLLGELMLYLTNEWVSRVPSHQFRLWWYRHLMDFGLHATATINLHARFDCRGQFQMGSNSIINQNCRIDPRGKLTIGENVSISEEVVILTADHDPSSSSFQGRNRAVSIGNFVWIGTRVLILPGVNLGEGSIVAAGAVVTKNVDEYTIVAGTPARVIGTRRRDLNYTCYYRRYFH